jgi:hypothetical protein
MSLVTHYLVDSLHRQKTSGGCCLRGLGLSHRCCWETSWPLSALWPRPRGHHPTPSRCPVTPSAPLIPRHPLPLADPLRKMTPQIARQTSQPLPPQTATTTYASLFHYCHYPCPFLPTHRENPNLRCISILGQVSSRSDLRGFGCCFSLEIWRLVPSNLQEIIGQ